MKKPEAEKEYTPKEAAKVLKTHVSTVYRLLLTGKLPATKRAGSRYLIRESDLMSLFERVNEKGPASERDAIPSHAEAMQQLREAGMVK